MLAAAGIILLLIALTALYVAAEFAAVGAGAAGCGALAEDGNPLGRRLLPIVENPRELDRYIAASQVGITLSSLILGAYAQAILAPRARAARRALVGGLQRDRAVDAAAVVLVVADDGRR